MEGQAGDEDSSDDWKSIMLMVMKVHAINCAFLPSSPRLKPEGRESGKDDHFTIFNHEAFCCCDLPTC